MSLSTNTTRIFGRTLMDDGYNIMTQVDSSTVTITPRFNTEGRTELKIGVLLPFSQTDDNFTAQIVWGGTSAIRMAVNDINARELIPGAYITLVEKDSFPQTSSGQTPVTDAVYASVTLLQHGVIGVIGDISSSWTSLSAIMTSTLEIPQCSFTASAIAFSDKTQYKYFFRTIPTQVIIADVMLSFAADQGWSKVGVLYTDDPLGQQFYQRTVVRAGISGLHLTQYHSIPTSGTVSLDVSLESMSAAGTRILLVAASGEPLENLMIKAAQLGYMTDDYVWLLMGDVGQGLYDAVTTYNTQAVTPINYNDTFSGVFMFDNWLSLYGYPPFEKFLDEWSVLDPLAYPFAGRRNITTNEGLAYSCMMVMAQGFSHTVSTISNKTYALEQLSSGELGQYMLPSAFNVGYVGPEGPMVYDANGDLTDGNYRIYNLQHGNQVAIGQSMGGLLSFTSPPMYHDGTSKPPSDAPPSTALNPNLSSPVAHAILAVTSAGILFSILVFCIVVVFRKNEVFKASSPLFCCLELLGFILTYFSVLGMIGIPTQLSCIVSPLVFNLGFLLVLGNMIAKNYRIYRIFNNIFITRTVITDLQLVKTVSVIVGLDMIIICIGLVVTKPVPTLYTVSVSNHFWICESQSSNKIVFTVLLAIYASGLLIFATFLAYKTRLANRQYTHYSECRQMGLSVYNILFSVLVGFAVVVNPMADFFTKYYITVITILWATTFSLLILFFPKLQAFYLYYKKEHSAMAKDAKHKEQHMLHPVLNSSHSMALRSPNHGENELMSLDRLLANDTVFLDSDPSGQRKASLVSAYLELSSPTGSPNYVEVHEGEMPVRQVHRYFPFLSQWKMQYIMVFPWLGYFSSFSKETNKGRVLAYTEATVVSAELNEYVIKVRGKGWYDMYIQLPDLKALELWHKCFHQSPTTSSPVLKKVVQEVSDTGLSIHPSTHASDSSQHQATVNTDKRSLTVVSMEANSDVDVE